MFNDAILSKVQCNILTILVRLQYHLQSTDLSRPRKVIVINAVLKFPFSKYYFFVNALSTNAFNTQDAAVKVKASNLILGSDI